MLLEAITELDFPASRATHLFRPATAPTSASCQKGRATFPDVGRCLPDDDSAATSIHSKSDDGNEEVFVYSTCGRIERIFGVSSRERDHADFRLHRGSQEAAACLLRNRQTAI